MTKFYEARVLFKQVDWGDLTPGQEIYYDASKLLPCPHHAFGPFTVVDPLKGEMKNSNGIAFCLPQVTPLVIEVKL